MRWLTRSGWAKLRWSAYWSRSARFCGEAAQVKSDLAEGRLDVFKGDTKFAELEPGSLFGEAALTRGARPGVGPGPPRSVWERRASVRLSCE